LNQEKAGREWKTAIPGLLFANPEKPDENSRHKERPDLKYSLNEIGFLRLFTNYCYNQLI
jgi:hypothetical protein